MSLSAGKWSGARRLKPWQILALSVALLTMPLAIAVEVLVQDKDHAIAFSTKERVGVRYLRPLRHMLEHSAGFELLANRYLEGDDAVGQSLATRRAWLDRDWAELSALDAEVGAQLRTTESFNRLKTAWAETRALRDRRSPTAMMPSLRPAILALNARVGDTSNLILDPDLDSYYLMDATVVKLPSGADLLATILDVGTAGVKAGAASTELRARILVLSGLLASNLEGLSKDYQTSFEDNHALEPRLDEIRMLHATRVRLLMALCDRLATGRGQTVPPEAWQQECGKSLDAIFALYDATSLALDDLLRSRVEGFERSRAIAVSSIAIFLFLAIALVAIMARGAFKRDAAEATKPTQRPPNSSR